MNVQKYYSNYDEAKKVMLVADEKIEYKEFIGNRRYRLTKDGRLFAFNKELKGSKAGGYIYARLRIDGKYKNIALHILIACAWIENKDPKKNVEVNHLDGQRHNNVTSNLVWVTHSQNLQHAHDTGLVNIKKRRILQLNDENEIVKKFKSITDASLHFQVSLSTIGRWCSGVKSKTGIVLIYEKEEKKDLPPINAKKHKTYPNYLFTECGKVWSIVRKKYLTQHPNLNGYLTVCITDKDRKSKTHITSRLIYSVFNGPIKKNMQIDHMDGDITNNSLANLDQVSSQRNIDRSVSFSEKPRNAKEVNQFNLETKELIAEFESLRKAKEDTGINTQCISNVCLGKQKSAGGYFWQWKNLPSQG